MKGQLSCMPVTVNLIFPGCELTGIQVPARGKKGGAELRKKKTNQKPQKNPNKKSTTTQKKPYSVGWQQVFRKGKISYLPTNCASLQPSLFCLTLRMSLCLLHTPSQAALALPSGGVGIIMFCIPKQNKPLSYKFSIYHSPALLHRCSGVHSSFRANRAG